MGTVQGGFGPCLGFLGFWGFFVSWRGFGVFCFARGFAASSRPPTRQGGCGRFFFLDFANLIEKNTPDLKKKIEWGRALRLDAWCLVLRGAQALDFLLLYFRFRFSFSREIHKRDPCSRLH